MEPDVLVIGAGPTGLVLALWLVRMGVRVRIVDKALHAGTTSRALAVQARTLELYESLDLAQPVLDEGVRVRAINLWARGHHAAHVDMFTGNELSRYPFALFYPQDRHEQLLETRLAEAGVRVERGVEITQLDGTTATTAAGERIAARFVAGCDGAHSIVRSAIGAEFEGGTYSHVFYVADVLARGPTMNDEIHVAFDDDDFLACFPLGGSHARLIGDLRRTGDDLTWNDVSRRIIDNLKIDVDEVRWFSVYRVHHRVASRFADGARFLLGDAAHIHSPVGGQGMNTGIGDAINLAWKLASVIHGRASAELLDSYAAERVPFAHKLVATTDRAFELISSDSKLATTLRNDVIPHLLPMLFKFDAARRFAFRTVSQIEIAYRDSPLAMGHAGRVHGGDRLPWIGEPDNYAPLHSLDWQVHCYGEASQALRDACSELRVALHVQPWNDAAHHAGFVRDAAYFVRPDGYVGLATRAPRELAAYWDARRIRP